MAEEMLVFGGPNLPPGRHTWIEHPKTGAVRNVDPGEEVPVSQIKNPDHYVQHKMASRKAATAAAEGSTKKGGR